LRRISSSCSCSGGAHGISFGARTLADDEVDEIVDAGVQR
jgi:hypothetical protein